MSPSHPVLDLISQGEHEQLDFKFEISDAHKIARTLAAFANTRGGKLLIGVKDNGAIAGVRSDEEYYMLDAAANLYCNPSVPFHVRQWNLAGKTVVEARIPPSALKPHFAEDPVGKWAAYIRVHDRNLPANRILLKIWQLEKKNTGIFLKYTEKERALLSYLEKHPSITITRLIKLTGMHRYQAEQSLIRLISLKILEIHFTGNQVQYRLVAESENRR
jgi:predicted HTH transcriptional regulator